MSGQWRRALLMASVLALLAAAPALAGPNGANVVAGSATVQGQGTANVTVNQSSQNAIINWQTFNIGAGQSTNILMPNASSAQLDRVTGGLGPSQIFGSLSSNGKVFLVNPDGILFGPDSRINVGSLLATTSDIADGDFMARRYNFNIPGNPSASIVNQGMITAQTSGFAALVAPGVRNTGTITAWLGRVGLTSANTFALDLYGDRLIQLNVDDSIAAQVIDVATGQPLKSLVSNAGKLKANGGTVQLTAVAARQIVDSVINNSGVIEANSVGVRNGMIVLEAATAAGTPAGAPAQTVKVSGKLSAAGRRKGSTGGTILITGENVALSGASINASGANGGGAVLIGGDWGGGHPNTSLVANASAYLEPYAVPTASTVSVDAATTINASATNRGNGGKVIVWSDAATTFYGTISAQGGAQAGNGGFVETSGQQLTFNGSVNTSASAGKTGTWLLEPGDLTVNAAAAQSISNGLASNNVVVYTNADGNTSGQGTAESGPGDIVIAAPISWSSANTLTLDAYDAIVINAEIDVMGAGGLVLDTAGNPSAPAVPLISFGGGSVQFTGTPNTGQTLTINDQAYTLLYSMSDLQSINSSNLSGYYALALPLDASAVESWTPIGTDDAGNILNSGSGFDGAFQGLGNAISNLTVDLPSSSHVGFFGYVGSSGQVANIGLAGGTISGGTGSFAATGAVVAYNAGTISGSYSTATVSGGDDADGVGGLVGMNAGSVVQSYATGAVSASGGAHVGGLVGYNIGGATITQSYATGAVSGSFAEGGLAGENDGQIEESYATGNVTANGAAFAGGLVGWNAGSISQSYAIGAVSGTGDLGGLVGYNDASITQTYATGAVTGTDGSTVGGLVGVNDANGTVTASYWDTTTGLSNGYGANNNPDGVSGQGLTTSEFGTASNFSGWTFGTTPGGSACSNNGACWVIVDADGSLNNAGDAAGATRPMLLSEWSTSITNAHQLQLIALDPGANYTLANNIDLAPSLSTASDVWGPNGSAGFVPISYFSGSLDGQGYALNHLTISSSSFDVGLFGIVGPTGIVQSLNLTNETVTGLGPQGLYVGGIAGENDGLISGSSVSGSLTDNSNGSCSCVAGVGGVAGINFGGISLSNANVTISGSSGLGGNVIGGLVGFNPGNVSQSYASGSLSLSINSVAESAVGGLVGINAQNVGQDNIVLQYGQINNSYATSTIVVTGSGSADAGGLVGFNIAGDTITGSHATGAVTDTGTNGFAGGLVGDNAGTIILSYATGAVTVGANSTAGGLVGENGNCCDSNGNPIAGASITDSYAIGAVSSPGINVQLGGLVGQNDPLSVIINSQAYGAVISTANLPPENGGGCASTNNCQYANVGGFVGFNYGTISGTAWTTTPANCAADYSCASGNVAVGSLGEGGGFVGDNQGIINYAFATGAVTAAAGVPDTDSGNLFNNTTQIGGFVGNNQGQISNAFATGAVGTAGTNWLSAGGFAASNAGVIIDAFATGAVNTGDNSTAGGFASSNTPDSGDANCPLCYLGDGYNDLALISNSQAYGNVTVGAASIAGGFAAAGSNSDGFLGGNFVNITASGAVSTGHDSVAGGLVGVLGGDSTLTNSTAHNTLVASSGPNSIIGGIVGVNFGTIYDTTSSSPVSGTSDSYIGGVTGINLGSVSGSSTDPAISGSGGSDFIGGIAGLNIGLIENSTAQVDLSSGPSSYIGGIAGVNGSYSNDTAAIPNSSFPNGTIVNSDATGSGFGAASGTSTPTFVPPLPSWLDGCSAFVCTVFTGSLASNTPSSPTDSGAVGNYADQQIAQFVQTLDYIYGTTPPPLITPIDLTTTGGNDGTGNGSGGGSGGGSLANGRRGGNGAPPGVRLIDMPVMPLPPGSGMPPPGETRFSSNEVVLQFGAGMTPQQIAQIAQRFGLTIEAAQSVGMLGRTVYTFRIGNGENVREVIRLIDAAGLRAAVQPNYSYGLTQDITGSTGDQGDVEQYIVKKLDLGAVHRLSRGDNVVVAVIDSEVDPSQPDFAGALVDRFDAGCGASAPDAHGTGMAGAIGSRTQLLGVAPNARIIAICAFGGAGTPEATSVKIIRGLDYAINHGAKIVNMSFAGPYDPALAQALQVAREKGVLIVAAAGNNGPKSPPLYPGADPNVMAVTATDQNDRVFSGANQGKYIAVASPGVNILVPAPDAGVQFTTGTSVATANVSGVAALLMAQKPSLTPEDIRALLVSTAKHLGSRGMNPQYGAGLVDPLKALHTLMAAGQRSVHASLNIQMQ